MCRRPNRDAPFAAIRECYNRRAQEPEFSRLTFCLLGVASPSDLIRDTRLTPFNIGQRIELTDFTDAEAAPLAHGLGRREPIGSEFLQRVLYWTGGHPYLTQRLCRAVAEDESVSSVADVDHRCDALFLSSRAQERDDNLLFVRERLLRSEVDLVGLLDLYAKVRRGRGRRALARAAASDSDGGRAPGVPDDETNPLVSLLRLSGIVRERAGCLRVRNRIYARVFDAKWIAANLPDAEIQRLREEAREEARKRRQAEERELTARRYLSAAQMNLAQQAWSVGHMERAIELLEAQRPGPRQQDLRGFAWRYLWRLCRSDDRYTFRGHTEAVDSVAFSPTGLLLATRSVDGTVKLWDVASRREVASFQAHSRLAGSAAFSPDGKILATAGDDNTIKLWDVRTKRNRMSDNVPGSGQIRRVAFLPDGRAVAVNRDDRRGRLWDVAARRTIATLNTGRSVSLVLSPDGRAMVTSSMDGALRLRSLVTPSQPLTLRRRDAGEIQSVALSPDGKVLAIAGIGHSIELWDTVTQRQTGTLEGHRSFIMSVAFSHDGKTLASASNDNTVKLWDLAAKRLVTTLRGHRDRVRCVTFAPDGKSLATGSADMTVRLWDTAPTPDRDVIDTHTHVHCVGLTPDGRTLASGHNDGVRLWDVATRRMVATLRSKAGGAVYVAFSSSGQLASGHDDGTIRLWDVAGRRAVATLKRHAGRVWCVAFSPDGRILASAGGDGTAKLWDVAGRREMATLPANKDGLTGVAFSPNGRTLAASGVDATIWLWDLGRELTTPGAASDGGPRLVATLEGHKNWVNKIAFAPDGQTLASGSDDNTTMLWRLPARQPLETSHEAGSQAFVTLKGHSGQVWSLAFSPDGKTLATAGEDSSLKLWDLETKQEVVTLPGHTRSISSVVFSTDGNLLATSSSDTTIRLWRAATFAETDAPASSRHHAASR